MTDPTSYSDTGGDERSVASGRPAKPGMPRWLKVSLIVVVVIVAVLFVLMRIGVFGAGHGPEQFGPGQHGSLGLGVQLP
jgi:hypothetical protein